MKLKDQIALTKKLMKLSQSGKDKEILKAFAEAETADRNSLRLIADIRGSNQETLLHQLCEHASHKVIQGYLTHLGDAAVRHLICLKDEFGHTPLYLLSSRKDLSNQTFLSDPITTYLSDCVLYFISIAKEIMSEELTRLVDTTNVATIFHGYNNAQVLETRPQSILEKIISNRADPTTVKTVMAIVNQDELNTLANTTGLLDDLHEDWATAVFDKLNADTVESAMLKISKNKSGPLVVFQGLGDNNGEWTPSLVRVLQLEKMGPQQLNAIDKKDISLETWYNNIFMIDAFRMSHLIATSMFLGKVSAPLAFIPLMATAAENMLNVDGVTVHATPKRPKNPEVEKIIFNKILDMGFEGLNGNPLYELSKIVDYISKLRPDHETQQRCIEFFNLLKNDCQSKKGDFKQKLNILKIAAKKDVYGARAALQDYKPMNSDQDDDNSNELKPIDSLNQNDDNDADTDGFVILKPK